MSDFKLDINGNILFGGSSDDDDLKQQIPTALTTSNPFAVLGFLDL